MRGGGKERLREMMQEGERYEKRERERSGVEKGSGEREWRKR